ncbi:MAG: hypothetical protein WED33_08525, partial [Bacteroidia bacterium]
QGFVLLKEKAMELQINKNTTLGELQDDFSSQFKYLKLGFFIDKNHDNRLTADEQIKNRHLTIGSIREVQVDGDLKINSVMTVADIERKFKEHFGLEVQIFRKSGLNWLITSQTDEWTLEEQNAKAIEMDKPVEAPEPGDYHDHE